MFCSNSFYLHSDCLLDSILISCFTVNKNLQTFTGNINRQILSFNSDFYSTFHLIRFSVSNPLYLTRVNDFIRDKVKKKAIIYTFTCIQPRKIKQRKQTRDSHNVISSISEATYHIQRPRILFTVGRVVKIYSG